MHPTARPEIQLLGPVGVRAGDGSVLISTRSAVVCLLAALAVEAGKPVDETVLLDRVWRDDKNDGQNTDGPGPGTLRRNIDWLRDDLVAAGGSRDWVRWDQRGRTWTLAINPSAVDYHRFLDEITIAHDNADWDRLQRALAPRQEKLLANVDKRWADGVRHQLGLRRHAAVKALFTHLLDAHRYDGLITMLGPCEDDIVHDEHLLLLGAQALAAAGRHAEITAWADRIDTRVHDELGVSRSAPTHAALQRLIADPPGPATHPPATETLDTLGLPRDITDFTGRDQELATLITTAKNAIENAANNAVDPGATTIAIHAIDGMPGVGKTALAIHAAHLLAPRFPDGRLLLRLHGHTPGQQPRTPFDALHALLSALGVHAQVLSTHTSVDQRARLWRTVVSDRKLLVILDDAAAHDQVEPLIPGASGCLVIITSRNRLPELDGVHPVSLDIVTPEEGALMLLRLARRTPDSTSADQVARVVELCGRLPIAIAVAASQLRTHPAWSMRYLADQLTHAHDRLDELQAGERSVRAVFDTSVRDLPADQHDLFTLLGVHHGPDIDAHATAALADTTPTQARHLLRALHTRNLVQETSPDRYRLHDLLRVYAHTHAADLDPDHRHQATTRVLDYYLHTAHTAAGHLPTYRTPSSPITPTPPRHPLPINNPHDAKAWLTTELPVLATAIDHTHPTHPTHTLHLSTTLHPYFRTAGHWHHAQTIHHTALTVAIQTNNPQTQATAFTDLGYVYWWRGDLDAAVDAHTRALQLFTDSGSFLGQGNALTDLGRVYRWRGDLDAAVDAHTRALQLFTDSGSFLGQGNALTDLGRVYQLRGDLDAAVDAQTRALQLFTDSGSLRGQGNALNNLGYVYWQRGDLDAAVDAHTRALQLFTDSGSLRGQGDALNNLGRVHWRRGDLDAAVDVLTRARQLMTDSGSLRGQGNALNNLGRVHRWRGDLDAAVDVLTRARQLLTDSGDLLGQADTHLETGISYHLKRDYDLATTHLTQAIHLFTRAGDTEGQAETHNALGNLTLDYPDAGDPHTHFTTALAYARDCGTKLHQANALVGQARCLHRTGNTPQAVTLLHQALAIHREIHAPEAAHTADLLHTLDPNNQH